jgi:hypothetical protein
LGDDTASPGVFKITPGPNRQQWVLIEIDAGGKKRSVKTACHPTAKTVVGPEVEMPNGGYGSVGGQDCSAEKGQLNGRIKKKRGGRQEAKRDTQFEKNRKGFEVAPQDGGGRVAQKQLEVLQRWRAA